MKIVTTFTFFIVKLHSTQKKTRPNAFGNEIEYANIDAVTGTNFRKDSQYGLCFHYFFKPIKKPYQFISRAHSKF